MASTTKKRSKNNKPRLRRPKVKTSVAEQAQTIAELRQQLQDRKRQLTEALEQQTATGEVLRVIASARTELQTVMDAIAENAARLCEADDVLVRQTDGNTYKTVSHFGPFPHSGDEISVEIGTGPGRAILERRTVHIRDIQKAVTEFPGAKSYAIPQGIRSCFGYCPCYGGTRDRGHYLRRERSAFYRQADWSARNVRRSGRDRYRKCPAGSGAHGKDGGS